MNVIISNEQQTVLAGLDIDIIKSLNGQFDVDELINMFSNFYFGRMILDLTAIKDYHDIRNLQKLSTALEVDKIILLLPANDPECQSPNFLSQIISLGIYNFTTNLDGVKYLFEHPNTYRDVAHIHQLGQMGGTIGGVDGETRHGLTILGIKNVTEHAGATSLIYMLKKELESLHGLSVLAIELNKRDFQYYNQKGMISISPEQLPAELLKHKDVDIILVDLNDSNQEDTCADVIYLIEPSTIRLNKLMRRDMRIFEKLKGKKIVLNQSLLTKTDIADFEFESKSKVFFNIPPLNDRSKNNVLSTLLGKLGIIASGVSEDNDKAGGGFFGLFRR